MRMVFGLAGLLVTIGVIAWIMYKVELPATQDAVHVQEQAQVGANESVGRLQIERIIQCIEQFLAARRKHRSEQQSAAKSAAIPFHPACEAR